jgi:hypothetical protein
MAPRGDLHSGVVHGGDRFLQPGNRAFCAEVTQWAFHKQGVLRVTNLRHKCAAVSLHHDVSAIMCVGG